MLAPLYTCTALYGFYLGRPEREARSETVLTL